MGTTPAPFRFALTTAHRVIDRVHYHATHVWPASLPARATSFAAGDVHVIDVSNLADGGETILMNPAHFARWHFHQRVTAFEVVQRRLLTGAASNLSTAAGTELDVVNVRSKRHRAQRQRIAQFRCDIIAVYIFCADPKSIGGEDVA